MARVVAGANGEYLSPALWGPESFNIGAGVARLSNAAGFVKTNMPLGKGEMLTDADAIDVAVYFIRQPWPHFPAGLRDCLKAGKPDRRAVLTARPQRSGQKYPAENCAFRNSPAGRPAVWGRTPTGVGCETTTVGSRHAHGAKSVISLSQRTSFTVVPSLAETTRRPNRR